MTCPTCGHGAHNDAADHEVCMVVVPCDDDSCPADAHHCACRYPFDNADEVPPVTPSNASPTGVGDA